MGTLEGMTLTSLLMTIAETPYNSENYNKLEKEVLRRFKDLQDSVTAELAFSRHGIEAVNALIAERDKLLNELADMQQQRDDYREAWIKLERPGNHQQHLQICGLLRDKIMLQAKLRRLRKRLINHS